MIEGGGFVRVGEETVRVFAGKPSLWPPEVVHGASTGRVRDARPRRRAGRRRRCPARDRRRGGSWRWTPARSSRARAPSPTIGRPPATTPPMASPSRSPVRSARQDRSELAEDPGGRAPHQQLGAVIGRDRIGAVAQRPVADRPLDDLDRGPGQEAVDRRLDDPGDLDRRGTRAGMRAATATTGINANRLTGIQTSSSRPTTSIPDAAGRPTSSSASRRAVATMSRSSGSTLPAGQADFARVEPVVRRPFRQDDPGGTRPRRAPRGRGRRRVDRSRPPGRRSVGRGHRSIPGSARPFPAAAGRAARAAGRGRRRSSSLAMLRRAGQLTSSPPSRFGGSSVSGRSSDRRAAATRGRSRCRRARGPGIAPICGLDGDRCVVGREHQRPADAGRHRR